MPGSGRPDNPLIGIAWIVPASMLFVALDTVTKSLAPSYPILQLAALRFLIHAVVVLILLGPVLKRYWRSQTPGLQLIRSAILAAVTGNFFVAIASMKLVDATAIMFATPVIVTALSVPMLGERVGARRWAAVLVGFAGAMLVVRPGPGILESGALFALAAAFLNALYQLTTRKVAAKDLPLTTLLWTPVVGAAVGAVIAPAVWVPPETAHLGLMLLLGVFGGVSHYCIIRAFDRAPAAVISPYTYLGLIWATLSGLLFFSETPDTLTMVGGGLIVGSGLYILHRERIRRGSVLTRTPTDR